MMCNSLRVKSFRDSDEGEDLLLSLEDSLPAQCQCCVWTGLCPSRVPPDWDLLFFRLLLQLAQSQQTSFALERNLKTQQEIEDKMKRFSFKEDTLLLIAEVSVSPRVYVKWSITDIFPGSETIKKKPKKHRAKLHLLEDFCLPSSRTFWSLNCRKWPLPPLCPAASSFTCRCLLAPAYLNIRKAP